MCSLAEFFIRACFQPGMSFGRRVLSLRHRRTLSGPEESPLELLEAHKIFFAELITAIAGVPHSPLTSAFASTPRDRYLGPGPWKVYNGHGYTQTPTADPTLLYQDIVVAIQEERGINNGQPSLHTRCLAALDVREGESVVHIGAGSGYYNCNFGEVDFCLGEGLCL